MKPGSEKDFGFVTAQIMLNVADDDDEDGLPNYVPASGTVTFSPKEVLLVTDDPALFLTRETVLCPIDPDTGKMVNPGTPKTEGVWLAAGIWTVSFSIGSRTSVQIPSFEVQITSSYTASNPLNLATVVPYTPPSDVTVIVVEIPAGGNPGDVLTWGDGGFHWQSNDAQAVRAEAAAVRAEQVVADLVGWEPGGGGASSWTAITGKPAVIAAGESAVEARAVIGAVSVEDLPDVSGFATTAALTAGLAEKQPAGDYATTASLATVATTGAYSDLTGKPTIPPTPDLSGFATKTELTSGLAGKQDAGDYALVSQLPDVSGLATTAALTQGLAEKQDAGDYATKAELPDLGAYATTAYVDQTVGDIDTVLSGILGGE